MLLTDGALRGVLEPEAVPQKRRRPDGCLSRIAGSPRPVENRLNWLFAAVLEAPAACLLASLGALLTYVR